MIRARVRSGMANASAKGAKIGRPPTTTEEIPAVFYQHYPAYKNGSLNVSELARVCNLSRTTVYKYIGLVEGKPGSIHAPRVKLAIYIFGSRHGFSCVCFSLSSIPMQKTFETNRCAFVLVLDLLATSI